MNSQIHFVFMYLHCFHNVFADTLMIGELQEHKANLIVDHHRSKRKILLVDNDDINKWPIEVPYFFNSGHFSRAERSTIRHVLNKDFQANTVLSFIEESTPPTDRQFIRFRSDGPQIACRASVGLVNATGPFTGQDIFLHDNCFAYRGSLIYVIAATLGMHWETQRPDRDAYVDIIPENAYPVGRPLLTKKLTNLESTTHGVPYDYGSIMHISAKSLAQGDAANTTSLQFTVLPKDNRYARTIGQRSELSFYDILALNRAYSDSEADACSNIICKNGGYPENDCMNCRCRDGFSGRQCEEIGEGSNNCVPSSGIINVPDDNTTQCLQSPNYGWPDNQYSQGDQCSWLLRVPGQNQIEAWFTTDHFYLPSRGVGYTPCLHWVEIRHINPSTVDGPRYCNSNISRQNFPEPHLLEPPWRHSPIKSTGNEMMINFKAPNFKTPHSKSKDFPLVGFRLCYKIAPRTIEEPETDGGVLQLKSDSATNYTVIYSVAIVSVALIVLVVLLVAVWCCCRRNKNAPSPPSSPPAPVAFDNTDYNVYYIAGAQSEIVDVEKKDPTKDDNQDNAYCELQRAMLPYEPPPKYEDLHDVPQAQGLDDVIPPKT